MKKLLLTGLLAAALAASASPSAQAWCQFNFGVGLNFSFASGDNSFLWGAYRSGPMPYGYGPAGPGFAAYGPALPPSLPFDYGTPYAGYGAMSAPGYDYYPAASTTPAATPYMPASYYPGSYGFSYYGQ